MKWSCRNGRKEEGRRACLKNSCMEREGGKERGGPKLQVGWMGPAHRKVVEKRNEETKW